MGKLSEQWAAGLFKEYRPKSRFGVAGFTAIVLWIFICLFVFISPPTKWATWRPQFDDLATSIYGPTNTTLASSKRGTIALMYSGTARSMSANFESHIVNFMAGCPYDVHLFFHTYKNDNRWPDGIIPDEFANYRSVNATLDYFQGYVNLDNEKVLFRDAVKANILEDVPVEKMAEIYPELTGLAEKYWHLPVPAYYAMWHSQRRGEEARQAYMKENDIDYVWTFRMRHDATYFTNWWQKAFDVDVYDEQNEAFSDLEHDVPSDWGRTPTWLHDLVYTPRLQPSEALFAPAGWRWDGVNDQFAAMSSETAHLYFMRVLNIQAMEEGPQIPHTMAKVHAETSVLWTARTYNLTVDTTRGAVAYDVVRAIPTEEERDDGSPVIACSYKTSGVQDSRRECRWHSRVDDVLRKQFGARTGRRQTDKEEVLMDYLRRLNSENPKLGGEGSGVRGRIRSLFSTRLSASSSSFYYWRRFGPLGVPTPCVPSTWTPDQENNYRRAQFPFVLRTNDSNIIERFKLLLTCGSVD